MSKRWTGGKYGRVLGILGVGLVAACSPAEYRCARDLECVGARGEVGSCVAEHCAYADVDCATALRHDDSAGAIAGECVSELAAREEVVSDYLAAHAAELDSFLHEPVGNVGLPMVLMRLLPDVLPDLWGDGFAAAGFGEDRIDPARPLPLGVGFTPGPTTIATASGPVRLNVATLTCAACHTGRVRVLGEERTLIGAPNGQIIGFRALLTRTIADPRFTADRFRAALVARPVGWLYRDRALAAQEVLERAVILAPGGAEALLEAVRRGVQKRQADLDATVGVYVFGRATNPPPRDAPTPGYLDALAETMISQIDLASATPELLDRLLPPAPAPIDNMSVFQQHQRTSAQWDGSVAEPLHRNLGASIGVVGDPRRTNLANAYLSAKLLAHLPPPPYPFAIDRERAARGQGIFAARCAGCHHPGNDEVYPEIGTDPNRVRTMTPDAAAAFRIALRAACTDPAICLAPDGTPWPDEKIVRITGGYVALPLDGIWTRAPYLHNGSVPTLRALLTGDRPPVFYRGNLDYDPRDVGFVWDRAIYAHATPYDTSFEGQRNTGHDRRVGAGEVDDLLEYLKTL